MIKQVLKEDTIAQAIDKAATSSQEAPVFCGQGDIEMVLDKVLRVNRRTINGGGDNYVNVLFIGGAGAGKTARIRAWAKSRHINLLTTSAATMDDTDLGGVLAGNVAKGVAVKLATSQFDELGDVPDSVLFLDEWNRGAMTVRGTLLTLIQNHTVPDSRVKGGQRFLPGFLFTVAAINPDNDDYGVNPLDKAEIGRMIVVYVKEDKGISLNYIKSELKKELEHTLSNSRVSEEDKAASKLAYEREVALAEKLLADPRFYFSDINAIKQSNLAKENGTGNGYETTSRNFLKCLLYSEGVKDDFINAWNMACDSLQLPTVKEILKDYKDVDDKANDVLAKGTDSQVFASKASRLDALRQRMKDAI